MLSDAAVHMGSPPQLQGNSDTPPSANERTHFPLYLKYVFETQRLYRNTTLCIFSPTLKEINNGQLYKNILRLLQPSLLPHPSKNKQTNESSKGRKQGRAVAFKTCIKWQLYAGPTLLEFLSVSTLREVSVSAVVGAPCSQ